MTDVFRTISSCIIALFCCLLPVFSITGEHPILIISSYNPDAGRTSGNISDFMEEFQRLGGTNTIALENMNCKSFSESPLWERRMVELLSKYQSDNSPALTVLIGQEAWAAYLSLPDSIRGNTPVVSALSSRNAILLPGDTVDLKTWMPESVDFFTDFPSSPIKAGFVYEYDVEANINMIKQMYPGTKNIAFVSDNSYGGVAMQAYVVKEMQKFPELNLILLDGRVNTKYTICGHERWLLHAECTLRHDGSSSHFAHFLALFRRLGILGCGRCRSCLPCFGQGDGKTVLPPAANPSG